MHIAVNKLLAVLTAVVFVISPFKTESMSVSAEGMVLINADTLEVLASSNPHKKLPMASTTKLMTALIVAETCDLDKEVVTTRQMVTVEGSSMGLLEGDTVSYYALLVGMMLPSGNDAANTAAIAVAGSVEAFAELMNERAETIGMTNSHFVTPSGLHDDNHYSTAYDMALLAAEVLKNNVLCEIVAAERMTVSFGNPPYKRTLVNHNKLLSKYEYAIGLKTGYTKKAGRCLVSAAKKNDCTVIAVTLNASDDWNSHEMLLDYGLSVLSPFDVTCSVDDVSVSVVGGLRDSVATETERLICGFSDTRNMSFAVKIHKLPFVYAPVMKGDIVGWVDYIYNGKVVHKKLLFAACDVDIQNDVQKSFIVHYIDCFKKLLEKCIK